MRGKKKEKWEKEELLVSTLKCRYGGAVEKEDTGGRVEEKRTKEIIKEEENEWWRIKES